jgi:rhamnogalacturonan endolyase
VNFPDGQAQFRTYKFGDANAIARHGIHGFQSNYEVPMEGNLLFQGQNTIHLTQSVGGFVFTGIMYDYICFEGPYVA